MKDIGGQLKMIHNNAMVICDTEPSIDHDKESNTP